VAARIGDPATRTLFYGGIARKQRPLDPARSNLGRNAARPEGNPPAATLTEFLAEWLISRLHRNEPPNRLTHPEKGQRSGSMVEKGNGRFYRQGAGGSGRRSPQAQTARQENRRITDAHKLTLSEIAAEEDTWT